MPENKKRHIGWDKDKLIWLFNNFNNMTYQEMGDHFGVSKQSIEQVISIARVGGLPFPKKRVESIKEEIEKAKAELGIK